MALASRSAVSSFGSRTSLAVAPIALPLALFLFLALLPASCAHVALVKTDGPSENEGISVNVVREVCTDGGSGSDPSAAAGDADVGGADALDLHLRIQFRNTSNQPVVVNPSAIKLVTRLGALHTINTEGPHELAPGDVRTVRVAYWKHGPLGCRAPMRLSLDQIAQRGEHVIPLRPMAFALADTAD
jgi:hypothetical protein